MPEVKNNLPNPELGVLGTLLMYPESFKRHRAKLTVELFSNDLHRRIFERIETLSNSGVSAEYSNIILGGKFTSEESVAIATMSSHAMMTDFSNALFALVEQFVDRQYKALVIKLAKMDDPLEKMQVSQSVHTTCDVMLSRFRSVDKMESLVRYTQFLKDNAAGKNPRVPTGWWKLDFALKGGLPMRNLSLIGGTPGSGKTSFMLNLGLAAAKSFDKSNREQKKGKGLLDVVTPKQVVLLEGEMSFDEIYCRLNAIETNTPVDVIESGEHYEQFSKPFIGQFYNLPFTVDICDVRNIELLKSKVDYYVSQGAVFILVDYLQKFAKPSRGESEYEAVSRCSSTLRELSLQHPVHICAASSLNRSEVGQGKSAGMHSLRGSGSIEHDATTIMILEGEVDEEHEITNPVRPVKIRIKKNRGGSLGEINLKYFLDTQRMEEDDVPFAPTSEPPRNYTEPRTADMVEEKTECPF